MQVLYQLSYGPIGALGKRDVVRSAAALRPRLMPLKLTTSSGAA